MYNIIGPCFAVLMEEQRLTMSQRNKVNYHLRNGDPLPPPRKPQRERQQDYEDRLALEIMQRAKSSRKRTLDLIQASGDLEIEKYSTHFIRRNYQIISNFVIMPIP